MRAKKITTTRPVSRGIKRIALAHLNCKIKQAISELYGGGGGGGRYKYKEWNMYNSFRMLFGIESSDWQLWGSRWTASQPDVRLPSSTPNLHNWIEQLQQLMTLILKLSWHYEFAMDFNQIGLYSQCFCSFISFRFVSFRFDFIFNLFVYTIFYCRRCWSVLACDRSCRVI